MEPLHAVTGASSSEIVRLAILSVLCGAPLVFAARTAFTILLRQFGLSHPNHYRLWPRLPWRMLWIPIVRLKEWREEVWRMGRRATGGFVGVVGMLTMIYRPGMVLLGRAYGFGLGWLQPIGARCSRHFMVIAQTGAGKTIYLVSIVALWKGSVLLIDPKGQVTAALHRISRKTWAVINPFGLKGIKTAIWNWYCEVHAAMEREGPQAAVRMAIKAGESLVITAPGDRSPFFPNAARAFVVSLLLFVLRYLPREQQNLITFRALLTRGIEGAGAEGQEANELLLYTMAGCDDFGGAIANGAIALQSAGKETAGNILATARESTKWLDLPELRDVLIGRSDFLTPDLKSRSDLVVSVVAPVGAIRQELAPLCRLLTDTTCHSFEAIP